MFKSLKVVAVLLVIVIGIVHGQNDSKENTVSSSDDCDDNVSDKPTETTTAMSTTESSDIVSTVIDRGLLESILDTLQASAFGIIFNNLDFLLRPIFWGVDSLLSPVFRIVRFILTPVGWIMSLLMMPIHGLTDLIGYIEDSGSSIESGLSLVISNLSGILNAATNQGTTETSVQQRQRRDIMESLMGMDAWATLTYPFRFVYDIISTLLSPFYYFYKIVSWPLHFTFGGDADNDISTSIATVKNYFPFSDMISALFLKLSDSSQEAIIELLKYAWVRTKEYLLPAVDELLVLAQSSEYVPDDIKTGLSSLHTAYSLLHMFGIL